MPSASTARARAAARRCPVRRPPSTRISTSAIVPAVSSCPASTSCRAVARERAEREADAEEDERHGDVEPPRRRLEREGGEQDHGGCSEKRREGHEASRYRSRAVNRLASETSPYLLQHAGNPVDWYPWGEEALAARARARPADPALDRLLGLPLVPRDGARELRGPGDRRADERALRLDQGRPRGAPRPRRDLHAGRARADRARRLADDGVPDARRASRSTAAPTTRPSRAAACPRSATCSRASPRPTASDAATCEGQAAQLAEALQQRPQPRERRRRARARAR